MTKNKNSWTNLSFIGLVLVVASVTIILSILTLFDQYHRYLELFSPFKFQYLLSSITCAVIFALCKNYKLTFLLLLVIGLNSIFVAPWYFRGSENTSVDVQAELNVLHSNVYTGNVKFKEFIELVNQEKPDFFVMQEVNQKWLSEVLELEKVYTHKYAIPREDNLLPYLVSIPSIPSKKSVGEN